MDLIKVIAEKGLNHRNEPKTALVMMVRDGGMILLDVDHADV